MPFISQAGQRGDGTDAVVLKGKRWIEKKKDSFDRLYSIFFKLAQLKNPFYKHLNSVYSLYNYHLLLISKHYL